MKAFASAALFLAALFTLNANAAHVAVTDPVSSQIMQGGSIDLGAVGPGQRIEIEITRKLGELDIEGKEKHWERLVVLKDSLPLHWTAQDSQYYEEKMKAFVLVPSDAADGEYEFALQAIDQYGGTPPLDFRAKVKITRDVFSFRILQDRVSAGAGQPALYTMTLINTGSASDAFEVEAASGLPSEWMYKKKVFVPHNSQKQLQYEVIATDQGEFRVGFKATSVSSERITATATAGLSAYSSLMEDAKAASRGVLLFPGIEQAVYSLIGLIATVMG
ncbi:MAG: hypothetical protein V1708_02955 [Candidatus Micrarchaeota archaeon]